MARHCATGWPGCSAPPAKRAGGALIAGAAGGQPVWTPRDLCRLRARRLREERDRVPLRAHGRGGRSVVPLLLYEGESEDRRAPAAGSSRRRPRARAADFLEALYGLLLVAGNAYVEAVAVGGRPARAARPAPRPHAGGAGPRRLARGLRVHGRRAPLRFRQEPAPACARSCTCAVPSGQRPLRHEPDRGGGGGDRHPQHGGALEQGAARQFGAPSGALVYGGQGS